MFHIYFDVPEGTNSLCAGILCMVLFLESHRCAWKQAVVVPILKPGKDAAKPGSHRPTLTAVLRKIMERR